MSYKCVSVLGLGYIGLPTAAVLASNGIKVLGVDINKHIVDSVNAGKIHIEEPHLDKVVKEAVEKGFLKASDEASSSDAFIIAVPTPFKDNDEGDPKPDLKFIDAAANAIAAVLKKGDLIILESTSPVGTTLRLSKMLGSMRKDLSFPHIDGENSDIRIAYCPERVLPGNVLYELENNARVIGGISSKCSDEAIKLYENFVNNKCISTNSSTAEMAKLTENSYRDVNIAFANELSIIAEKNDINIWELIELSNLHPRVNILKPGPGVGGHCIAVDPWFIVSQNPDEAKLIKMARVVNDYKPEYVINRVIKTIQKKCDLNESKIGILGLSYKPDIDDLRESPSLGIAINLSKKFPGKTFIVEPHIEELPKSLAKNCYKCSFEDVFNMTDLVIALVPHREFKDFKKYKSKTEFIDFCGLENY